MPDERPRGVHLSDKQLVFTFMTATVVLVVVFLCGVLVGRGVQTARGPLTDSSSIAASQVVGDGGPAEAPVADGVARPGEGSGGAGAAVKPDAFTYPDRLGTNPPADKLKVPPSAQDVAPRASAPPPDVPAEPVAKPEAEAKPASSAASKAASAPGAGAARESTAAPGDYTVQIAAVKDRGEAAGIVRQLKTKGYDAFLLSPDRDDRLGMFRVRIGSFKDKRKADALAQRLLREEKRYKPWVTR